jgi:stage V sporulation protein SpoVS
VTATADAHKVAGAIEAVMLQADAAYVGVIAIMQTLFNRGQLNQAEVKAIADAMVALIPVERHHAFAQSIAGMLPEYKSPRAAKIS